MTFASPHIKLTFGGTTASAKEIWACHLTIGNNYSSEAVMQADFDAISNNMTSIVNWVEDWFPNTNYLIPTGVKCTYIKIAPIGTDGKYIGPSVEVPVTAIGNNANSYAPQVAMAVTLVADKYKDPGKYNRFYLPITLQSNQGQSELSAGLQTNYLTRVTSDLGTLNYILSGFTVNGGQLVVASATGTGSELPAVSVRLGRVLDTQKLSLIHI